MDFKAIFNFRRHLIILTTAPIIALVGASCDHSDLYNGPPPDVTAPPVPNGVVTTTMDQKVYIEWNPVSMDPSYNDLAGYQIYRSYDNHNFSHIATVASDVTNYLDEGLVNGTTYYYAISSFDLSGNVSDLSLDSAYDTPRPEGTVILYTLTDPDYEDLSGFDFSLEVRRPWNDPLTNFYLQYDDSSTVQTFYIIIPLDGSRIQDMGYTQNFDEITYAPQTGWSTQGICEAIVGHTYVIKTANNHYAKVRVVSFSTTPAYNLELDWGYQVDPGNRELKVAPSSSIHATGNSGGVF